MASTAIFLLSIMGGVVIALNRPVWVLVSYGVIAILIYSMTSKSRDDQLREAKCAECGRNGELLKPLEHEKFYFLRCESCKVLWNLRIRFVNEDHDNFDGGPPLY